MKKTLIALLLTISCLFMVSCGKNTQVITTTKDTYDYSGNPNEDEIVKLNSFTYGDITLYDSLYKDVFDGCLEYYMSLTPDDILYNINRYIQPGYSEGEDIGVGAGGNVVGQWMQAYARFYDATKDPLVLEQCTKIMNSMNELSEKTPQLLDAKSCYCFEKYLRGFLDMYTYCGIEEGFDCAKRLMDFALGNDAMNNPRLSLGDNGGDDEIEWYTMCESIMRFYEIAREENKIPARELNQYYEFAKKYIYKDFYDIFVNGESLYDHSPEHGINIQYFHAYSHVNTFNSAAALYKKTGDSYYLTAMTNFYDWLDKDQKLATGGFGCHTEWLAPREEQIGYLQTYHDNYETQCSSYAMYRLDNNLMNYTGKSSYGDWTEQLFYNATLASLETESGFAFYYSDYCTSGGNKALKTNWKWSCCTGTRPLAVLELLRSIYFNDGENLYINLFTNSEVNWERENDFVKIKQETSYPIEDSVKFTVNTNRSDKFGIKIRNSKFASSKIIIKINGEEYAYKVDKDGWIDLNRVWSNNDEIEIVIPMSLSITEIEEELYYGTDGVWAMTYGPITLAAKLPFGIKPKEVFKYENVLSKITKGNDNLHYTITDDGLTAEIKPFYEYKAGEGYYLYFDKYTTSIFD